jgi:F plasmid transfer operon, TraF, protein
MKKRSLLFSGLMLAGMTNAYALPYGFSDARSVAMGNVSVATGGVTTAAFSNPAMLMVNESDDTFALHIGAGVVVIEDGGISDDIDEFQAIEDQISAIDPADSSAPNAQALLDALNAQIQVMNNLDGDSLIVRGTPNVAVVYGGDIFSVAVTAGGEAYASAATKVTNLPLVDAGTVLADLTDGNGTINLDPSADLEAVGVITQEIGVSIATNATILGMDVSFGIKPKVVSAEAITFNQGINTVDVEDIIDDSTQDLGSFTTLDAGIAIGVTESIRVGVVAKNLISETLTVSRIGLPDKDIDFDTQLRVGVAYNNSFMTVAADMDLIETDPILAEDANKMLALGVELNAFDFVQLRAGYQKNMASGASADDLISAGIGLWLGFNLDIAAVVSEDSVGAFVQTGFRF